MTDIFTLIKETWDYSDPEETENKFNSILNSIDQKTEKTEYLQILSQVARAKGLQQQFSDAHKIFDKYKDEYLSGSLSVKLRYYLERGRLFNSDNKKEEAKNQFKLAWSKCEDTHISDEEKYLQVDVAHMLAIVEQEPKDALKWNEKAIDICESTDDPLVRGWLGSLYNNTGWAYHDMKDYNSALNLFEKAYKYFEQKQAENQLRIAKWTIGRVKRSLGEIDEALKIQHEIEKDFISKEQDVGGYTLEELGELYLLKNEKEKASLYFSKAYEVLSQDIWLQKNEADRLERMRKLSQN